MLERLIRWSVGSIRPGARPTDGVDTKIMLGWYYRKGFNSLFRGLFRAPWFADVELPFFLGAHVRIDYARQIHLGRGVHLGANSFVNAFSQDGVRIGPGVTIRENAWIQCASSPALPGESLTIGSQTYIGPGAIIGVGGPIVIGEACQIGAGFTVVAENHEVVDGRPSTSAVVRSGVSIGDGCWIGHRVVVLDGVHLGRDCVVGAGAVVTKSFPQGSTIAGVPAKEITRVHDSENGLV